VEKLLNDPDIISVDAPVDANVWKVEVEEGGQAEDGAVVSSRTFNQVVILQD
jgi:urea carboxylase